MTLIHTTAEEVLRPVGFAGRARSRHYITVAEQRQRVEKVSAWPITSLDRQIAQDGPDVLAGAAAFHYDLADDDQVLPVHLDGLGRVFLEGASVGQLHYWTAWVLNRKLRFYARRMVPDPGPRTSWL